MKGYFDGFPDERSAALQAVIMGRGEVITLEQFNELMLADIRGEMEAEGFTTLLSAGTVTAENSGCQKTVPRATSISEAVYA
jgi:hypothetical protein